MEAHNPYSQLPDLVAKLQDKLQALENGQLSATELTHLTDTAREVYERLLVLRYKAFETLTKGENPDSGFRLNTLDPKSDDGQTNLIDAIQEIQQEDEVEVDLFSLETASAPELFEAAPESVAEVAPEPEPEVAESTEEKVVAAPEVVLEPNPEPVEAQEEVKEEAQALPSVTSVLDAMDSAEESIAERLERAPLTQLQGSISLNQKFLMLGELFDGDSGQYEATISALDAAGDHASAQNLVHALGAEPSPALDLIHELVERRYPAL